MSEALSVTSTPFGSSGGLGPGQATLATRGVIGEPLSPATLTSPGFAPSATVLWASLASLPAGQTVTSIVCPVLTAGAGTAPTLIKLGIYTAGGSLVAGTANVASDAMWTSLGQKTVPLTGPVTIQSTGGYYLVFLTTGAWGTTALAFPQYNLSNIAGIGSGFVQIGNGARLFARGTGSPTDLPATTGWQDGTRAFYFAAAS